MKKHRNPKDITKKNALTLTQRWRTRIIEDFGYSHHPPTQILAARVASALKVPEALTRDDQMRLFYRYLDERHPEWSIAPKAAPPKKPKNPPFKARLPLSVDPTSDDFLLSYAWRQLRMKVLDRYGPTCQCCGAQAQRDRVRIHVDHIKPRKTHPELALVESNLQILCEVCNHGKGNWNQRDWRPVDDIPKAERPRLRPKPSKAEVAPFWDQFWTDPKNKPS